MDQKSMKNRSSGSSWAKMAPRRCHLEPTWLQEPVFEWFSNQLLNQFRLLSDWFWADIFLQELLFIIFKSILDYFRLMSDRFWIDIYSISTWIGLMFTRCWDRLSSGLRHIYTDLKCDTHWRISSLTFAHLQYLHGSDSQHAGHGFQTEHSLITISSLSISHDAWMLTSFTVRIVLLVCLANARSFIIAHCVQSAVFEVK